MLDYSGSLRYDMHGRKRKTKALSKPKKYHTKYHTIDYSTIQKPKSSNNFKSMPLGSYDAKSALAEMKKRIVAQQESAKYTIAPAYNKGAYQVIPRREVKDIGR